MATGPPAVSGFRAGSSDTALLSSGQAVAALAHPSVAVVLPIIEGEAPQF